MARGPSCRSSPCLPPPKLSMYGSRKIFRIDTTSAARKALVDLLNFAKCKYALSYAPDSRVEQLRQRLRVEHGRCMAWTQSCSSVTDLRSPESLAEILAYLSVPGWR